MSEWSDEDEMMGRVIKSGKTKIGDCYKTSACNFVSDHLGILTLLTYLLTNTYILWTYINWIRREIKYGLQNDF